MKEKTRKKITKWFWMLVTVPFAAILLLLVIVGIFAKIPSFDELEHPDSKLATQIIAEDGEVLSTFHIENRTYVPYEELSPSLVQAAISTEDVRFYKHSGIDMKGLGRVLVKTLLMRDSSQGGGSTITQQLAKTLYPRTETRSRIPGWSKVKMVWIKLKEWITAVKLERDYTKDEIVDMYLNSIFYGSGAYGIGSASRTFFAKDPIDLTVEESAMLVGMVNKPTRYNPSLHPELALERRNFVIGQMAKAGYISEHERDSIRNIPIELKFQVQDHNAGLAPYFRDMLRRDLSARQPRRSSYPCKEDYTADSLRWETDPIYGWLEKNKKPDGSRYNIDRDGLRIYTTINYRMQKYAEEAVCEYIGGSLQKSFNKEMRWNPKRPFYKETEPELIDMLMSQARRWSDRWRLGRKAGLSEKEIMAQFSEPVKMRVFSWNRKGYQDTVLTPDDSIRYYKSMLRTGFVAMEPGTGNVKAYVGGPNYRYFKYDNVRQGKRQVGSTIKPFLYTLAMQSGMNPCDRVVNLPQTFVLFDSTLYTPRSTDAPDMIGQTVTLKWGLANSSNNISAFLMKQLGPESFVRTIHQMGISTHIDPVYSLCVGPADICIYDMVAAYNTFPSYGVYVTPQYVSRIEDNNGNVITETMTRKRDAIPASTAYLMVKMMEGVINEGTGIRLRWLYALKGAIAGKTGTTNDNSDGWFIGYTPTITAGVWVGGEDRQIHFESLKMGGGSNMALPIWGIWMKKCIADGTLGFTEKDSFIAPPGVSVDLSCDDPGIFLGGYAGGKEGEEAKMGSKTVTTEEDYYFN